MTARTPPPWVVPAAGAWVVLAGMWFATRSIGTETRAWTAVTFLVAPDAVLADDTGLPRSPLHPARLLAWVTAFCVWATALAAGGAVRDGLRLRGITMVECLAVSLGGGIAMISLAVLLAGLAGWPPLVGWLGAMGLGIAIDVGSVLLLGWPHTPLVGRICEGRAVKLVARRAGLLALAVVPFLLLMAWGSTVPTSDFDSREYHLMGPREWHEAGRIAPLPHNTYTSMPAGTGMLTLLAMSLSNDVPGGVLAAQATLAGFVPLCGLAAFCVGRRLFGPAAGWWAAAAWLCCPWAVRLACHPYAEGGLAAFATLTLLAVTITLRRGRGRRPGPAALAGCFAGAAFSCKYPGLVFVVIPAGLAVLAGSPVRRWGKVAAFAAGVLVFASPWLIRNAIWHGNPVFPLLWEVFGGDGWDAATNARWRAAHAPPNWSPARWPHWAGQPLGIDPLHTPLLVCFAPLALLVKRRRAAVLLGVGGALLLAWYALTHRIDRFWAPLLPGLLVPAGAGLAWATGRAEPWVRQVAWGVVGVALPFQFALCLSGTVLPVPFTAAPPAAGAYIEQQTAPLVAALNDRFDEEDTVLLIGEAQVIGARFRPVYATVWDAPPLADPAAALPPDVAAVAVNWSEVARYKSSYGFDERVVPGFLAGRVRRGELEPPEVIRDADGRPIGEVYAVLPPLRRRR